MRYKNILFIFIVTLFILIFDANVYAEARSTLTFTHNTEADILYGKDYLPLKSDGSETTTHFSKKLNPITNRYGTYCIESSDVWFSSGTKTYSYSGEMNAKIAYVIGNGYPNKNLTGNDDKDYFITGLAVFYFVGTNENNTISFSQFNFDYNNYANSTYGGHISDVARELAKLIDGANKYVAPSMNISVENNGFTLSSDGKYYVSKPISVTTTGVVGNYMVSLSGQPNGTIITDIDDNIKNTFAPNTSFLVKIPVANINKLSTDVNVSISAVGTIYKAYRYNPPASESNGLQSVVIGESISSDIKKSLSLELSVTTSVEISKVDATNSKELPGAHLVVRDSKGQIRDEWNSTDKVHIITPMLEPGEYTLTETIAPKGYKESSETITFTVKADGKVIKKTMKNYPEEYNTVKISKQDVTTEKELPGATLILKDANGKQVDKWISGDTPYEVELAPGKYTLTETIAPKGYKVSEEAVEFTVEEDGTVKEPVIMYNEKRVEPVPTGDALIYFAWIIGAAAIGYSIYYFNNLKKGKLVE